MIIRLVEVPATGREYEGVEPPEIVDVAADLDVRLLQPIAYTLRAVRIPGALLVSGELSTQAEFRCARCDEPFPGRLREPHFERAWELTPDGLEWVGRLDEEVAEVAENSKETGHSGGGGRGPEGRDCVDLTDDIREAMILAFPGHPVCRPDCKGLCATCGANLNKAACRCTPPPENRWAILDRWGAQ